MYVCCPICSTYTTHHPSVVLCTQQPSQFQIILRPPRSRASDLVWYIYKQQVYKEGKVTSHHIHRKLLSCLNVKTPKTGWGRGRDGGNSPPPALYLGQKYITHMCCVCSSFALRSVRVILQRARSEVRRSDIIPFSLCTRVICVSRAGGQKGRARALRIVTPKRGLGLPPLRIPKSGTHSCHGCYAAFWWDIYI